MPWKAGHTHCRHVVGLGFRVRFRVVPGVFGLGLAEDGNYRFTVFRMSFDGVCVGWASGLGLVLGFRVRVRV